MFKSQAHSSLRTTMIRIIADDITRKTTNPTKNLVDQAAAKVARRYPECLLDKLDELIIGHSGLTKQIYSRIENKGRKLRKMKGDVEKKLEQNEQPKKMQCVAAIDSYGCLMWSPPCPSTIALESMQTNKKKNSQN